MALIQSTAIPSGSATGYEIDQSLRFEDGDSANLSWTPSSAGNRLKWTFSTWMKRGTQGTYQTLFAAKTNTASIFLTPDSIFRVEQYGGGGAYNFRRNFNPKLRDSSAWYHVLFIYDSAQGAADDRIKFYLNGVLQSIQNDIEVISSSFQSEFNNSEEHWIGRLGSWYYDGLLAETHFIDGQAVTPADFGETGDYGEWKPKRYSGTYGTNGFYLDFADSSALGDDESGNTNDWTANNFTASDQVLDSPTQNFATFNVLDPRGSGYTFAQGNLYAYRSAGAWQPYFGTMGMPSGKWYWEAFYKAGYDAYIGAVVNNWSGTGNLNTTGVYTLYNVANGTGYKYDNGVQSYGGAAWHWSTNKILQVAYDADTGKMWIGENNTWYSSGNPSTGANPFFTVSATNRGNLIPAFSGYDAATKQYVNFGQDSSFAGEKTAQNNTDTSANASDFYYTPPTDFLALNVKNLPEPDVIPSEHFNTVLYTGTDATNSTHAISGIGFSPSLVWTKDRGATYGHYVFDAVRGTGVTKGLRTNIAAAEGMANQSYDALSSFDSDGFSITGGAFGSLYQDRGSANYVAWNWKANGSGSSNTTGSINTISTSANVNAGFSIVKWVGNEGADESLGHGLSKAPEMIITCNLDEGWGWAVYHKDLGKDKFLLLAENTATEPTDTNIWADTAPTSSVFYVGTDIMTNWDSRNYIGYCFHSVDGYSKVGSYIGNSSADGTFVHTGFRPKWILMKNVSRAGSWYLVDTKQDSGFNSMTTAYSKHLVADTTAAQDSPSGVDFLSNGFKLRTPGTGQNYNTDTIIYLAFASVPFKLSNAR